MGGMNTSPLNPQKASKEKLLALTEKVPGAWIGIKIATLLLVLEGQRPVWISEVLGQNRMNVNRWTRAVNKDGVEALIPKKQPGRPARMTPKIAAQLELHLEESPQKFGLNRIRWDGPTVAAHLQRHFGVKLKVRQAQQWMHRLGYRLKRASHVYLQAKAEDAKKFAKELKKTQRAGA
jgi:transposase